MPSWFIPENFKKTQASKLGDAQGIPFFINNLSGHFQLNYIFIRPHLMNFTWSVCLFLFSFIFCNKLGRILAFLCGRETRSAFSCEYSYSSFLSSCCISFQLLFCMHLLFRAVSFCRQVVYLGIFLVIGWKHKMLHVVVGIVEKTCIILQITKLFHLNHCCCFEILTCLMGKLEGLVK